MTPYEGGIRIALVWEMGRLRGLTKEKKESHSLKGHCRQSQGASGARTVVVLFEHLDPATAVAKPISTL